ncbi:hypothetical protein [Halomonas sp. PR-M31]|uniref:hypothetical protein n=1 Tax=Halomonas sp. PR-M31 TaxID=1471202 RepID=UPI00065244CA|nr:hypothetical protein [Halomonas sp. PR-M31]
MKLQMTVAAIAIALLPVAAQASVATHRAMEANSESLQHSSVGHELANTDFKQRYSGESAAAAEHARYIANHTEYRTQFTDTNEHIGAEKPKVGHATDW